MATTTEATPAPDVEAVDEAVEAPASGEPGPFALAVDPDQQYKAKELKICSFARPHMRAFHVRKRCHSQLILMRENTARIELT